MVICRDSNPAQRCLSIFTIENISAKMQMIQTANDHAGKIVQRSYKNQAGEERTSRPYFAPMCQRVHSLYLAVDYCTSMISGVYFIVSLDSLLNDSISKPRAFSLSAKKDDHHGSSAGPVKRTSGEALSNLPALPGDDRQCNLRDLQGREAPHCGLFRQLRSRKLKRFKVWVEVSCRK